MKFINSPENLVLMKWLRLLVIAWLFPIAVWAQTVSVVPSTTTYVPTGGTVSFTVTLTYTGVISAVAFQIGSVPAGWSFVSAGGISPPSVAPSAGTASAFEFAYTSTPASPITFTFTAAYPAGLVGSQIFSSVGGSFRPGPIAIGSPNVVLTASTMVGAPAITRQPSGAVLTQGDNYALTVEASGSAPLIYQWRKDTMPIAGATTAGLTLTAVKAADAAGYSVVVTNAQGFATSVAAVLTVEPVAVSRLANLSVRSVAGSGDQTLIVGFAVGGTGVKSVLLRGVGPGLTQFGLPGALMDPQLRLFNSSSVQTHLNEDWGGGATLSAAFSGVGAFGLPAASKDAALLVQLGGGVYTAQITGNGGTGIALMEVYDSDAGGSAARLTNLSARTQVGTGDDILVVGFVVTGTSPRTLLMRAVGPGLLQFALGGVLADPQLKLFNAAGALVTSNDDWGGGAQLAAAFSQAGAFALPAASKDAVLLSTLPAGAYTVQVSGANGTRGIALVEVYELPQPGGAGTKSEGR